MLRTGWPQVCQVATGFRRHCQRLPRSAGIVNLLRERHLYHPNENRAWDDGSEVNRLFPAGTFAAVRRFHERVLSTEGDTDPGLYRRIVAGRPPCETAARD